MNIKSGGVFTRSEDNKNLLIRLKEAQGRFGHLSREVIGELADTLGVPISQAYGVATFYSFLSTRPLGKNVILICKSLPCFLKNSEMIVKSVEENIGIRPGQTTPDGKFSFRLTNCIGACDKAPAMMINTDVHGELTPDKIARILRTYH